MYSVSVNEKNKVIGYLRDAGVLDAIRWAYDSALSRTLADYSEDAGHDSTLLGVMRHTLFRDRLDRVFSCGKYQVPDDAEPDSGLAALFAELPDKDIATMPRLDPGLVRSSPLNGSPAWRLEDLRILMTSCDFGKTDTLPWGEKSETKQRVAKQHQWDGHPSLFDDTNLLDGDWILPYAGQLLDLESFVVAHTLDAVSQKSELVIGSPRLNLDGGEAWHWRENLGQVPPTTGGRRFDQPHAPAPDTEIADAPVRLRRAVSEETKRADAE